VLGVVRKAEIRNEKSAEGGSVAQQEEVVKKVFTSCSGRGKGGVNARGFVKAQPFAYLAKLGDRQICSITCWAAAA
jgi:hypothetical protein